MFLLYTRKRYFAILANMKGRKSPYHETSVYAIVKSVLTPFLRPAFCKSVPAILYNFFYSQWKADFLPGRIPVSKVDHPLDEKIPFTPSWVTIYLDFVHFWIRMLSFFLRRYGRRSFKVVREFIYSMGRLYEFAAEVYSMNMSTTKRPFYIARPRFFVIHMLDPHLMCIPSLHVMVVIHTYTMFEKMAKELGEEEALKEQILEVKQGALAISQAILFVKQHSVNCIPAALYAMTCYSPDLFPVQEARAFTESLFSAAPVLKDPSLKNCRVHPAASPSTKLPQDDVKTIKKHIFDLYEKYLKERDPTGFWGTPVLDFLRTMR
jgi:hypothetical protein